MMKYSNLRRFCIPSHTLNDFEMQSYYQYENKIVNFNYYKPIGIHWIGWYANRNNVMYFHSFGVEDIPNGIKNFISSKKISSIQIGSITTFCSLGYFWAWQYRHILNYINYLCTDCLKCFLIYNLEKMSQNQTFSRIFLVAKSY